jgi:hypothetical protein
MPPSTPITAPPFTAATPRGIRIIRFCRREGSSKRGLGVVKMIEFVA